MNIQKIIVGELETNCYILTKQKESMIIDPGAEYETIKKALLGKNVIACLITHHHQDHIGALENLKKENIKIYDNSNLQPGIQKIGNFTFEVIPTKGHKEDAISFYFPENILFSGDFIFKGTIGRTDLEGGDFQEMKKSIETIITYPQNMKIYPGHGEATTLKEETENLNFWLHQ